MFGEAAPCRERVFRQRGMLFQADDVKPFAKALEIVLELVQLFHDGMIDKLGTR